MTKKSIILVLAIVALAGIIYFFKAENNKLKAYEFSGQVKQVNEDTLKVNGQYLIKDHPEMVMAESNSDVSVKVDSNTKITRELIFLPTSEELKATNGIFDPSKAKRESAPGTLDDLKRDAKQQALTIEIKTAKNVYKKSEFTASEIKYIVAYDPDFFGEDQ